MSFVMRPKFFSIKGYKRNSPDVNNPYNIIPSGDITMDGVEFPVHGIDNEGNEKIMKPGKDYKFPGDMVLETPLKKTQGCTCWKGYSRVPGKKPCAPGSCKKS